MSRSKERNKKSKIKYIIYILLFICLIVLGYFFYNKYKDKIIVDNKIKFILKDDLNVEINSQGYIKDYVLKIDNGELVNGEEEIDTSILGEKKIDLVIKNKDQEEEKYNITINIVDTTKPTIEAKNEVTTYVGNNINLLDGVIVSDNSGEEINALVIGEYDINKVGKYNLKYIATDKTGNSSEYDFILNVISDPNNYSFTTSKGFSGKVVNGITYIDGVLIANKTYSLPSSYGNGLKQEMQSAFNKLRDAASGSGYKLYIGSGYRSYWDQKIIYNNYVSWDGQANADTYSARPGHSEHQTGLAIDVCDSNVSACITSAFDSTDQAKWINDNCYKYGLIIRYPKGKDNITGYMYESWHLRYVGVELATKLYNDGNWITLEEYYGIDSKYH